MKRRAPCRWCGETVVGFDGPPDIEALLSWREAGRPSLWDFNPEQVPLHNEQAACPECQKVIVAFLGIDGIQRGEDRERGRKTAEDRIELNFRKRWWEFWKREPELILEGSMLRHRITSSWQA